MISKKELIQIFDKLVVETYEGEKLYITPSGNKSLFLEAFLRNVSEKQFIQAGNCLVASKSIKRIYYTSEQTQNVVKIGSVVLTQHEKKYLEENNCLKKKSNGKEGIFLDEGIIKELMSKNGKSLSLGN